MKKLRVGMIGGGANSFFGPVHARAIALDNTRELVAGVLRSRPAEAMKDAAAWGIVGFEDCKTMLDACKAGHMALDYVTITTTNNAHFKPARDFIRAGIPVLCEKPITFTADEAAELAALVKKTGVPFVLAHTYTGHPMMMYARELVSSGAIGKVRKVEAWYRQGWLATALEKTGQQQAGWRTDPRRSGVSGCGGDIGTHAFIAATWVTGLAVKRLRARLNCFVEGRALDDDFNVIAELSNGGTAVISATQIAVGYRNDSGFRVFGTTGSLEWRQEEAEKLLVRTGETDQYYFLGSGFSFFPESVKSYLRVPAGHNEDFFEALANLHTTMERTIRRARGEKAPEPFPHPGVKEGLAGMRFIEAAVESSGRDGAWVTVPAA